jgi:TRAP-type C4-dicarboxylate transport system permease large subunit
MDPGLITIILFGFMLALLASGLWIAISLIAVGFLALEVFSSAPAGSLLATTVWDASWNWALTALPLFIWMGEILFRSRLSADMFNGLAPWLSWLPGRLLHVNIVGCGVMAAVAGSSAVTCATVARMSIPELRKRGYDESLSIGTLAGSGTLGLLIPPSIMLIVYGVIAQVSISRLFMAGVFPGILLISLFMAYVMIWSLIYPGKTPKSDISLTRADLAFLALEVVLIAMLWAFAGSLADLALWMSKGIAAGNPEFDDDSITGGTVVFVLGLAGTIALAQISTRTKLLVPVLCLITAVLGSIYGGVATPTEAATIGVIGALVLAAASGSLNWQTFVDSLMGAMRTACMISFILVGAAFLSIAMGFTGIPRALATLVENMNLSPYMLLAALTLLYIVLGCFLDGVSMMVVSASVVLPMVQNAGIDLLWFGIYIVVVVEMAQITPPVGFNLFVLQSMTGRDIMQVTRAAMPFFGLMLLGIVILTAFPSIATFLPNLMVGR